MKRKLPWMLLGIGLFVGFVFGAISSTFFLNKIAAKHLADTALVRGFEAYGMLSEIRTGQTTNTVEQLEETLDSSVISASVILDERLGYNQTASLQRFLAKVAQYRRQYPRTNESPEFQEMVDAALKSAELSDNAQSSGK